MTIIETIEDSAHLAVARPKVRLIRSPLLQDLLKQADRKRKAAQVEEQRSEDARRRQPYGFD